MCKSRLTEHQNIARNCWSKLDERLKDIREANIEVTDDIYGRLGF